MYFLKSAPSPNPLAAKKRPEFRIDFYFYWPLKRNFIGNGNLPSVREDIRDNKLTLGVVLQRNEATV